MKSLRIPLLCTLLSAIFGIGCAQNSGEVKNIDVQQFAEAIKQGDIQIVDVRTDREVATGMVEGALHIDVHSVDIKEQLAKLDKSKPVYIYCAKGGRSANACGMMPEGFEVYNVSGGMGAWNAAGLPTVKP